MEASKPLCFASKIDFFDANGQQFSVGVSGASDNSVMTVFPYLMGNSRIEYRWSKNRGTYLEYVGDDTKLKEGQVPEILQWAQWLDSNSSTHFAKLESKTLSEVPINTKNLVTYLNASILKNPITEFPENFIQNNGRTLFELIEQVSQRKLPFDKSSAASKFLCHLKLMHRQTQ